MHTHVRTNAYICVHTCTIMFVRVRNHVNTHLRGGFYIRLKPQISVYWFRRNSLKNLWFFALLLHVLVGKVPADIRQ